MKNIVEVLDTDEETITVRLDKTSAMVEFAYFLAPFGNHVEAYKRGEIDMPTLEERAKAAPHDLNRDSKDVDAVTIRVDDETTLLVAAIQRKGGTEYLHHKFMKKED